MSKEKNNQDYGNWLIKDLSAELKRRNLKCSGKKAVLVERLRNNDLDSFQVNVDTEDYVFQGPDLTSYRDLNSNATINVDSRFLEEYIKQFDNSYKEKGFNMYKEKYLLTLRKSVANDCDFFVGRVASEYRKQVVYSVNVKFSNNGFVSEVECECAAGTGPVAFCKHTCVVFEAIRDFAQHKRLLLRETCTSRLQTFHTSKPYTGSPKKTKQLVLSNKLNFKSLDWDPRPAVYRTDDQDYCTTFRNKCISYAAYFKDQIPILQTYQPANLKAVFNDHDYTEDHPETSFLKEYNLSEISYEEIARIENSTRGQSACKEWRLQRSMRLTSSMFGPIITSPDKTKMTTDLLCPKNIDRLAPIAHGKRYEPEARAEFVKLTELPVAACGTFVSKHHPFLSSSPDGLVGKDATLEIKCPYQARNKKITMQSVDYLYMCENDCSLKLDENHRYFYQVQGQMYCAEKLITYFVVYTIKDILVLEIRRDDDFIDSMVAQLNKFFHEHFKQAILDRFLYKTAR